MGNVNVVYSVGLIVMFLILNVVVVGGVFGVCVVGSVLVGNVWCVVVVMVGLICCSWLSV